MVITGADNGRFVSINHLNLCLRNSIRSFFDANLVSNDQPMDDWWLMVVQFFLGIPYERRL